MFGTIVGLAIVILGVILVISMVNVVRQEQAVLIETLGKYTATWEAGLHFKIPLFQRIANRVTLKEQVADFPPQAVITKDNVTITADSVVYFKVVNPYKNTYGVVNDIAALEKLTATTLRSIIGDMDLDATFKSREDINTKMLAALDEAVIPWGIDINRIEVQNITPPVQVQEAMEKQVTAERNKRAIVTEAEGQKKAAILKAEGEKESMVVSANGQKESAIIEAEGYAEQVALRAKADADAVLLAKDAEAQGIQKIKEAKADENVLTLKRYEAMVNVANGAATTIYLPQEMAGVAQEAELLGKAIAKN